MVTEIWRELAVLYSYFVIIYFILINLVYLILLVVALPSLLEYIRRNTMFDYRGILKSEFAPSISVLVPAYNEEKSILQSVHALLKLYYSKLEVIVINDGSIDSTMALLIKEYDLVRVAQSYIPRLSTKSVMGIYRSRNSAFRDLVVVDKVNGGKSDALNCGVNISKSKLVCTVDADSILEGDALLKVVKPYLEDPERVVATGGIVRIVDGCEVENGSIKSVHLPKKWLAMFQVNEYLRAFLTGRVGWSAVNGLMVVSGAFALFKRVALIECGGFSLHTVGEDMELVTRLERVLHEKKQDYRVVFVPDPVCWTEAPKDLKTLSNQRNRWHRGLIDTMRIHKRMLLNPSYGVVGMLAFPYYFFFEMIGPFVELTGVIFVSISFYLHIVEVRFFILFLVVAVLYGIFLSVGAILLEEYTFHRYPGASDLVKLVLFAVLENFGYRQMTAWWRVKGGIDYMRGAAGWGTMKRSGFEKEKGE